MLGKPGSEQCDWADILGNHAGGGVSGLVIQQRAAETNAFVFGYGGTVGGYVESVPVPLATGQWQHIALVKDATELRGYVNGDRCGRVRVRLHIRNCLQESVTAALTCSIGLETAAHVPFDLPTAVERTLPPGDSEAEAWRQTQYTRYLGLRAGRFSAPRALAPCFPPGNALLWSRQAGRSATWPSVRLRTGRTLA